MASVQNRSRWLVVANGKEEHTFKGKKEAQAFFEALPPSKKNSIRQLETTFEAQIKLRDKEGNIVKETKSYPTKQAALDWADKEEKRLLGHKQEHGKFDHTYETITFEQALWKCLDKHYKGKASYKEHKYRIPQIVKRIGKNMMFKEVKQKQLIRFRQQLEDEGYAESSIINYFSVISRAYTLAIKEWCFPVENEAKKVELKKPDNAIERNWESEDEKERLFESILKTSPWLLPIAEMSLEMTFRLGELVKPTLKIPDDEFFGLRWEGVDFVNGTVRIFREKNDWKKATTEMKGRVVPMTQRMKQILLERHGPLDIRRTGPVFHDRSKNSVTHAIKNCCQKAEPPIENLTFHSFRKIATFALSRSVENPLLLGKLTGHRDIKTLNDRYYKVPIDDLKILVNQYDEKDIVKKAIIILTSKLGEAGVKEFLKRVRELSDDVSEKDAKDEAEIIGK